MALVTVLHIGHLCHHIGFDGDCHRPYVIYKQILGTLPRDLSRRVVYHVTLTSAWSRMQVK
jgi:hypothetical protein